MLSQNDIIELLKIFERSCVFIRGSKNLDDLPNISISEVGFIGRSNVGKSSLINAITRRKIARSSNTPGRTQQLNFFSVDDRLMLVDMPGYGYAKAPREIVAKWQNFTKQYLRIRVSLKKVYILIDSRHGIKPNDTEMMMFLEEALIPYQIILTKIDKISTKALNDLILNTKLLVANFSRCDANFIPTSAGKDIGIVEVRESIIKSCLA